MKDVQAPAELVIDDEFAKGFGLEILEKLRSGGGTLEHRIRQRLAPQAEARSCSTRSTGSTTSSCRRSWSRPGVRQSGARSQADKASRAAPSRTRTRPRKTAQAEYRKIAERRVRLGLVLAEIGEQANVQVTDDEVTQALRRARPPVPRPGAAGLGLLPQEPAGPGRDPRADLRGQGRRPHPRDGQGDRQDGLQGRADDEGEARKRSCAKPKASGQEGRCREGTPTAE